MEYPKFIPHSAGLKSASGLSTSIEPSERSVADRYKMWTEPSLPSTSAMKRETWTTPQRSDLSSLPIIQSIDWESTAWGHLVKDIQVSEVLPIPLITIGNYQRLLPAIVEKFLPKIDDALRFLNMKIESFVEGIFFKFKGTPRRTPGFVVDMRIVISEYDRKVELEIYHVLANMIRKNPELLFDTHVIASKGRKLEDFLPHDYNQYVTWSG